MLRIYGTMIEMVREMRPTIEAIARRDPSLGDQLRRAVQSVVLNTAEGMGSRGRNRPVRYHSALGSMREAWACIEVAEAFGYVQGASDETMAKMREVTRTLMKLAV